MPPPETAASLLSAYEPDPLSSFGQLDDYLGSAYAPSPAPDHRPRSPVAYAGRPNRYRRQDEDVPRWVWYAMAGALAVCALVFLAILLITVLGRESAAPENTLPTNTEQAADSS